MRIKNKSKDLERRIAFARMAISKAIQAIPEDLGMTKIGKGYYIQGNKFFRKLGDKTYAVGNYNTQRKRIELI